MSMVGKIVGDLHAIIDKLRAENQTLRDQLQGKDDAIAELERAVNDAEERANLIASKLSSVQSTVKSACDGSGCANSTELRCALDRARADLQDSRDRIAELLMVKVTLDTPNEVCDGVITMTIGEAEQTYYPLPWRDWIVEEAELARLRPLAELYPLAWEECQKWREACSHKSELTGDTMMVHRTGAVTYNEPADVHNEAREDKGIA